MNQLTVSSDTSFVSFGPGLRWGDVYNALDPYGVSVIGGRIPHVGVAGLILGGCSSRGNSLQFADKDLFRWIVPFLWGVRSRCGQCQELRGRLPVLQ